NHIDGADDVRIELVQAFGRYPILFMNAASDDLSLELGQILTPYGETRDVSKAIAKFGIPFPRDLGRVFQVGHWIKDRLPRQGGGDLLPAGRLDQPQPDIIGGSEERDWVHA